MCHFTLEFLQHPVGFIAIWHQTESTFSGFSRVPLKTCTIQVLEKLVNYSLRQTSENKTQWKKMYLLSKAGPLILALLNFDTYKFSGPVWAIGTEIKIGCWNT
jgi:hypothetical protein